MEEKFDSFLVIHGDKIRTKSEPKPCTQNTKLCGIGEVQYGYPTEALTSIEAVSRVDTRVGKLYAILLATGCRVSEVLSIAPHHITLSGTFAIKGSKGSGSRVYKVSEVCDYMKECKRLNVYPFATINRFYVYRLFKKLGIQHKFEGNEKYSVTHLPRHIAAIEAKEITGIEGIVQDRLRHKSSNNAKFYEKER